MNNEFDPYRIEFIKKDDIIEEIEDGHSGAFLYKMIRNKDKYCIKVFHEEFSQKKINKILKSLEIYKKLNIPSLEIISYGNIKNLSKFYIVYNFIEGLNLKKYLNLDLYKLNDIRKVGKCVGKKALKLKMYEDYDKKIFVQQDINCLVHDILKNFDFMMKDKKAKDIIIKYFKMDEIDRYRDILVESTNIFKKIETKLIHGDIKRSNFMMNQKGQICFIDIEDMQVNYEILNFRYQMTWILFKENKREKEFIKGYFDGLYNNQRPPYFNEQIIFISIFNFLEESYNFYKDSRDKDLDTYVQNCKILLDTIKEINAKRKFIL